MPNVIRKTIAVFEIVGGISWIPLVLFLLINQKFSLGNLALAMVLVAIYLLALFAGVMLWRDTRVGRVASVIAQLIQLPKFITPGLAFMVSYGLDLSVLVVSSTGPSGYGISIDVRAGAYHVLFINPIGLPAAFGVSVVSCLALVALLAPVFRDSADIGRRQEALPDAGAAAPELGSPNAIAEFLLQRQALEKAKCSNTKPVPVPAPPPHAGS